MRRMLAVLIILAVPLVVSAQSSSSTSLVRLPHVSTVMAVAYSPDGRLVATGSGDRTVQIWDVEIGEKVQVLEHPREIYDVEWSSNGLLASTDGVGDITIWDSRTWHDVLQISHKEVYRQYFDIDWKPDGTQLAAASENYASRVFDMATGKAIAFLFGHDGPVSAVAWSPDGKFLLSGGWDSQLILFRANSGKPINRMTEPNSYGIEAIAWHSDGMLAATADGDGVTRVWDVFRGSLTASFDMHTQSGLGVLTVAFSSDGMRLASGDGDGRVSVWHMASGNLLGTYQYPGCVYALDWSPDGTKLAFGGADDSGAMPEVVIVDAPPLPATPTPAVIEEE